ncbi:ABC transporter substrate-binding protein [Rhodobacter sp. NTK016B]|uniref:ABC transporter substrate-binding protein n=1 Tax=Rhodobacter sp. NTK016B TaxID=2759676 RepID=UPI001A8F02CD|nr:ABC transporter substrate-binding protein [Rhodobacter sp. NTK016B]MBN8292916.1 ABC transporter substrate-binding protein [Rhodobacter sp. NTK016B]
MISRTIALAAAAGLLGTAAGAQDAYRIGLSGALTGPVAGSYAPAIEGLQLYINRLNDNGGINGHPVELIVLDDSGEPSRGATNSRRLLGQEDVVLMINASLSSTYAPMMADARRAGVPLLFASSACPAEVYPPAEPLLFCTTAFAARYDSQATLDFIEAQAGTDISLGLSAMAIPLSRGEIEAAEGLAAERGMRPQSPTIVPPPTADYTPFATTISQAGADWVYSWAPWVTEVRTFEALRRLGWEGDYIAWAHLEAEGELARLQDPKFYAIGANSLFAEDLPVHQEIRDAAEAAGATYAPDQMAEGWIAGLAIEAALQSAGWPADAEAVNAAMENLNVDTQGLRGGPIEWTAENHFRATQYYRVYRWNADEGDIDVVQDWAAYTVE